MGAVTYFVRMVANEGRAEEVQQLGERYQPRRAAALSFQRPPRPGIASHVGRQAPAPVTHDAVLGDLRVAPLESPLERWPSCPASAAQALPTLTTAMCGRPRPPAFGLAAQLSKITWLAWHLPGVQNVQIRTAPASSDPSAKRLRSGQSDCPHIRLE